MEERVSKQELVEPGSLSDNGQVPKKAIDCCNAVSNVRTGFKESQLLREVDFSQGVERKILYPSANIKWLFATLRNLVNTPKK